MATKKRTKLFDKIKDKVKPILTADDLGFGGILELSVYHPTTLSKAANLTIYESQETTSWLQDRLTEKSEELDNLRTDEKPDQKNLNKRKVLTKDLAAIKDEIEQQIGAYIEALARLKPGEFKKKIDELYENVNESESTEWDDLLDYPRENLFSDIFREINQAIVAYNSKELGIELDDEEGEKKK